MLYCARKNFTYAIALSCPMYATYNSITSVTLISNTLADNEPVSYSADLSPDTI